jgi:glycosyltransferase involved in cell wall biosynthesis
MTDVMYVMSGLGRGGAETMLVQLAAGLRARGLTQHVVSLSALDAFAGDLRVAGVDVTVLNAQSPLSLVGAMATLLRSVQHLRPRILQGWMYNGNIAATLAHYLCPGRRERRLFWNLRASNMDEARYGRIVRLSALLSRLPDLVIANSQAGAAFHLARGLRPQRLEVVDNGIDTRRFRPDPALRKRVRAELAIADDALVVIHVARVDPMKDHDNFLAAMAQLPSVAGIMVGDGTQALSAPSNVRALGLRRDTERFYAAADAVASSSAFGEGFSNVIAEGMSTGLVPVATDVGDARRIVGETGFIVPPRDPQALARAIGEAASLPRTEFAQRAASARARILANFSLDTAIERYRQLYSA